MFELVMGKNSCRGWAPVGRVVVRRHQEATKTGGSGGSGLVGPSSKKRSELGAAVFCRGSRASGWKCGVLWFLDSGRAGFGCGVL